jgi:hypothetical protein
VQAQISDASGFVNTFINSGQNENKGVELMVNLIPIETGDFTWDFTFAGAYNITKVIKLLNDTPGSNITVGTHVFNGWVQQIVGEELGQIVVMAIGAMDTIRIPTNHLRRHPLQTRKTSERSSLVRMAFPYQLRGLFLLEVLCLNGRWLYKHLYF